MRNPDRRTFMKTLGVASFAGPAVMAGGWRAARAAPRADKIKIGQIGTAHAHAAGKISTMRKFNDLFEVVGVVEPDEARRNEMQGRSSYRDVRWMSEDELLQTRGLQAVAVETAVGDLVATAARCVAAGVHVHLDKPAGDSLPEFRHLFEEATRRSLIIQMGYMYRYNPAFQFLFNAVRNGWLGDVFEVHAVMSKTVDASTRKQLAEFPGGSMFELGCHLIDAVVSVLGKPNRVTPYIRRTRPDQDTLADNCLAVFEYPTATATIRSSLIEAEGFRRRQFVVCGNRGTIVIRPLEPPRLSLTLSEPQGDFARGTHDVPLVELSGRYDGDFRDLAQILRGEKPSDYPPAHDLAVQEAILRASGMGE